MADICPPASGVGPFDPFEPRYLDCETDSVTVCLDEAISVTGIISGEVEVTNEVDIRPLDCEVDSVTICVEDIIPVEVTNSVEITGSVENKHPGVPGVIVPGSRWQSTGYNVLTGTLTITSPTPAGNRRVVCDWLNYSLVAAALSLGGGTSHPQIFDGGGGPVIWQTAFGLLGTIAVGAAYSGAENPVLIGSLGTQLVYQLPATLTVFDKSLSFGGYIVEV